jgi:hypothetical protein
MRRALSGLLVLTLLAGFVEAAPRKKTPRARTRLAQLSVESAPAHPVDAAPPDAAAPASAVLAPSPARSVPAAAMPASAMPAAAMPVPAGSQLVEVRHRRWGLFAGGVSLFALAWAADIGVTYGMRHEPAAVSLIPLIGPLIQCGEQYGYHGPMPVTGNAALDRQMASQIESASNLIAATTYVGLALDFAAQLTGLTMAIVGAVTQRRDQVLRVAATGQGLLVRF